MSTDIPAGQRDRSFVPWYRRCVPSRRTVALVLLLIAATPFCIRWYRLSLLPDVPVPFDVEAFCQVPENNEENAFYYFAEAEKYHHKPRWSDEMGERWGKSLIWSDIPDAIQSAVIKQQPAVELYRRGGRCSTASYIPPQDYRAVMVPHTVIAMRGMQRTCNLEFLRLMHEGKYKVAAEHLHDTYRASRHLGRRGVLMERLVGIACLASLLPGWHEWSRQPEISSEQIEAALARIREDWKLTPPLSDSLRADFFVVANETKPPHMLLTAAFNDDFDAIARRLFGHSAKPLMAKLDSIFPNWQRPLLWTLGEPELTQRAAKLFVCHELKYCDLKYAEQPPILEHGSRLHYGDDRTAGLSAIDLGQRLDQSMLSAFHWQVFSMWHTRREAAQQALLEVELELQSRFRRALVKSAADAELVLHNFTWPIDPCDAEGRSILYRPEESGLVVWSRGHNGVDDGGDVNDWSEPDVIVTIPWPAAKPDTTDTENVNDGQPK